MSREAQDPTLIHDVAAYFGATASEPDVTSSDAARAGADEATQAGVQADVNEFFGVGGG